MHRPLSLLAVAIALAGNWTATSTAAEGDKASDLPLKKVVMFNSGVGFFEHRGDVTGDAKIDLKFNVDDINDLLKSMVVQDEGGGRISTVTYGSKDPITKTLQTFAIDLTSNPTLGDILNQVRGERVELDAPNAISGVILGIEKRQKEVGAHGNLIEYEVLNLLTDGGLRSVSLETVGKIKLTDPKIDAELRQALRVLALGHATDKKTVSLSFLGAGKRPVRIGYIQETPVWKTSYRLVLSDKDQPLLQGWAIVENTTEEDWKEIGLTLVSGRPISFIQDLYQPLYVTRPVVEPELYASLRPQTYGQDMAARDAEFRRSAGADKKAGQVAANGRGLAFGGGAPAAPPAPRAMDELAKSDRLRDGSRKELQSEQLKQTAQSVAQADEVGEMFQYAIATPVTLPRQQSAMLPIVNDSIKAEKVSIYNPAVQAKHPLSGLRLTNSTDLHLMQGPITVFDGGAYAGDARIEDLQPGTERLISYALDLDTEVARESKGLPQQLVSVKIVKGTLLVSHKQARSATYTIKNSDKKTKKVLIETQHDPNWKLVEPKEPNEKTRDVYRFAVNAEPGKPATFKLDEEMTVSQQLAITNMDDNTIIYYINQPVVSEAVKKALKDVIAQKGAIAKLAHERQQMEQEIATIDKEQTRIRQNMAQLDRNTDLYQRYVKKFGEQEDAVEKLRKQIQMVLDDETKLRRALDDYLLKQDLS